MKSKFLFLQLVTSKESKKTYAIGHLIDEAGKYSFDVVWIEVDAGTADKLKSLSVYSVFAVGLRNNKYPVWSFNNG